MGRVVELAPRGREDFTRSLGMIIALGSWAMMFGALFFIYLAVRSRAVIWPPLGVPRLPLGLPAVATGTLVASSVALELGARALRRGRRRALAPAVAGAALLGAAFLGLQLVVWRGLWEEGLRPGSGPYGSTFYGLTALHALHVAAGLIMLLVVLARALGGAYTEHNAVRVRVGAMFWHFVGVVWLLMFAALYLL
jgi:heme/copper-type cytochrome/quinol oxidase subunit 3